MSRLRVPLLLLLLTACGGTTQGDLLSIPFQAGGVARSVAPDTAFTLTSLTNWDVTLTSAVIGAGPFYFNLDPPPTQGFRDGTVIMQVLQQVTVDVLDPTLYDVTGGASGLTGLGTALYVEIDLLPLPSPYACPTPTSVICDNAQSILMNGDGADGNSAGQESQVFVEGTAIRHGTTGTPISFEGWVTINQAYVDSQGGAANDNFLENDARVPGASVDLDFSSKNQVLQFRVDPTHWFDSCDFSVFQATPLDTTHYSLVHGKYTWANDSEFHSNLLQGIQSSSGVYDFTLASG